MSKDSSSSAYGVTDVVRQTELLVMDYLRTTKCKLSLDKMTSKLSMPSTVASELYALDLEKKRAATSTSSVLGYMVSNAAASATVTPLMPSAEDTASTSTRSKRSVSSASSSSASVRPLSPTNASIEGTSDFSLTESVPIVWTKEEIHALKRAIKSTAEVEDKTERWKQIAAEVGNGKSKKHCYLKYKELREEKKSSASPRTSSSSSSSSRKDSISSLNDENETPAEEEKAKKTTTKVAAAAAVVEKEDDESSTAFVRKESSSTLTRSSSNSSNSKQTKSYQSR
jgi:hypothetical protein